MSISYNGYSTQVLTFEADTDTTMAHLVKIDANSKSKNTADGDNFIGYCLKNRDGISAIQMEGYVELNYTGTAPSTGLVNLVSNSTGGVKTGTAAAPLYKVLTVDTTNKTVGFIL